MITVNATIHVYHESSAVKEALETLQAQIAQLVNQGDSIMSKIEDLRAELEAANVTTNASAAAIAEIQTDINDLIAQLAGGLSPEETNEVQAKLQELNAALAAQQTTLTAVAATHTPTQPTP